MPPAPAAPSITSVVEPQTDNSRDQLRIGEVCLEGGLRKVLVFGKDGIRVGFDEIDLVVRSKAEVEARIAVDGEQMVDPFADLFDADGNGGINVFGKTVLQSPPPAVLLIPLRLVGGDLRLVRRHLLEYEFADGKSLEPVVAENADVQLAAFDVFLGDGVIVVFLVNELHALLELLVRLDEGRLRNSVRSLLLQRFHQDGKPEPFGARKTFAAREGHEIRCVDAMVTEDLLGNALVLAEREPGGAAARERQTLHFEKRCNVLVERAVVLELVGEVEDEVRLEALQFLPHQIEVVEDGEMPGGVTEFG